MAESRFRYVLDALLRKRRSDWKTVKLEEATAAHVVERRDAEVHEVHGSVNTTEQLLRQGRRDGEAIDPLRQHILAAYLAQQRGMLTERRQALGAAGPPYVRRVHDTPVVGARLLAAYEALRRGERAATAAEPAR